MVLLDGVAAAMRLGVSPSTLTSWRAKGLGPAWVRVGAKLVKYRADALEAYLEAATRASASHAETDRVPPKGQPSEHECESLIAANTACSASEASALVIKVEAAGECGA